MEIGSCNDEEGLSLPLRNVSPGGEVKVERPTLRAGLGSRAEALVILSPSMDPVN